MRCLSLWLPHLWSPFLKKPCSSENEERTTYRMVFWEKLCWCWEGAEKGSCKASLNHYIRSLSRMHSSNPFVLCLHPFCKGDFSLVGCSWALHYMYLQATPWPKVSESHSLETHRRRLPGLSFPPGYFHQADMTSSPPSDPPSFFCPRLTISLAPSLPFSFSFVSIKRGAWWAMAFS